MSTRQSRHESQGASPDSSSAQNPSECIGLESADDASANRHADENSQGIGSLLGPSAQALPEHRDLTPAGNQQNHASRPTAPTPSSIPPTASHRATGGASRGQNPNMERYTLIDASTLPVVVPAAVTGELPRIEPHERPASTAANGSSASSPSAAPPASESAPSKKSPFNPLLAEGTSARPSGQPATHMTQPPTAPPAPRESRRPAATDSDQPVATPGGNDSATRAARREARAADVATPVEASSIDVNPIEVNPSEVSHGSTATPDVTAAGERAPEQSRRQRRERRPATPAATPPRPDSATTQVAVSTTSASATTSVSSVAIPTATPSATLTSPANPTTIPGLAATSGLAAPVEDRQTPHVAESATPGRTKHGDRPEVAVQSRAELVATPPAHDTAPASASDSSVSQQTAPSDSPEPQASPQALRSTPLGQPVTSEPAKTETPADPTALPSDVTSTPAIADSQVAAPTQAPRGRARTGGGWRPSASRTQAVDTTPAATPNPVGLKRQDASPAVKPDVAKTDQKKTKRSAKDNGRAVRIKGGSLGPQKQTRPVLIGVAIATILGSAAVFGSLYLNAGDRMEVLVAAGDIQPGEQITRAQLTVGLAAGEDFSAIKAANRSQYVGKIARGFIPKGSVVTDSHFAQQEGMQPGTVATPLELAAGRVPHGLTQGREITVWSVGSGAQGDDKAPGSTRLVERALVTNVNESPNGGVILTIITTEGEAQQLASLAARKSVAVSLLPARSPEKP